MFPELEVRHLHAVIVLAEERNFTRAADRLHITQSTLSKQITEIEQQHRFHLFTRNNKKNVQLTEVGRILSKRLVRRFCTSTGLFSSGVLLLMGAIAF